MKQSLCTRTQAKVIIQLPIAGRFIDWIEGKSRWRLENHSKNPRSKWCAAQVSVRVIIRRTKWNKTAHKITSCEYQCTHNRLRIEEKKKQIVDCFLRSVIICRCCCFGILRLCVLLMSLLLLLSPRLLLISTQYQHTNAINKSINLNRRNLIEPDRQTKKATEWECELN